MRGWIEVHQHRNGNEALPRSVQVSNIRWVGNDEKGRGLGCLATLGDEFIVLTKEPYEQLMALIEKAKWG